jgi:hypothetical protein
MVAITVHCTYYIITCTINFLLKKIRYYGRWFLFTLYALCAPWFLVFILRYMRNASQPICTLTAALACCEASLFEWIPSVQPSKTVSRKLRKVRVFGTSWWKIHGSASTIMVDIWKHLTPYIALARGVYDGTKWKSSSSYLNCWTDH